MLLYCREVVRPDGGLVHTSELTNFTLTRSYQTPYSYGKLWTANADLQPSILLSHTMLTTLHHRHMLCWRAGQLTTARSRGYPPNHML